MTKDVETYFQSGCGRCELGGTPLCKVHTWSAELQLLRNIVLACGLQETCKWGVPCYTYKQNNIVLVSAFKSYCSISFFKGALLQDPDGLLEKPGENTQGGRLLKFTEVTQIQSLESIIRAFIFEAIEIENQGLEVVYKKEQESIPEELQTVLNHNAELKAAFEALTPGKKRSYILHVSQAKQSKTRATRAEKCAPKIMLGKGFNEY